jgi:hypothetical protein
MVPLPEKSDMFGGDVRDEETSGDCASHMISDYFLPGPWPTLLTHG